MPGAQPIAESVASTITKGPAWPTSAPPTATTSGGVSAARGIATTTAGVIAAAAGRDVEVDVYESGSLATLTVHATIDVTASSAAIAIAEGLGDPRGALAARLAAIDVPFRLREIAGH